MQGLLIVPHSIVLPDIAIRFVEQFLVGMELVFEKRAAKFLLHHGADALGIFDQYGHFGGSFGEIVSVLLAQASRDLPVGFVYCCLVDLELHLRRLEVQRQRGLVSDGILKRVAAHVTLVVLVRTEGPEGIAIGTIDGRPSEAKEERVRQRLAHLAAQVPFLSSVRFVHHHDYIRALVQAAACLAKFMQ